MASTSNFNFVSLILLTIISLCSTRTIVADNCTSLDLGPVITKPGCPAKCGNLTVPYPFGIGAGCQVDPLFEIICNSSFHPPKALLAFNDELEVLSISEKRLSVRNRLAYGCYNGTAHTSGDLNSEIDLRGSPFSFSISNKLTLVGCDDLCIISRAKDESSPYISSCVAICSRAQELVNGSCSGIGCCEASVPKGLQYVYFKMYTWKMHREVRGFNPCGYSFLAEKNSYVFRINDVLDVSFANRTVENVPIAIDWEIGNSGCKGDHMLGRSLCQENSICVDSETSLGGMRCNRYR